MFESTCGSTSNSLNSVTVCLKFIRTSRETVSRAGATLPFRSTYILKREFRGSQKLGGFQLDNVIDQLVGERRIFACGRPAARGPSSPGYAIEEENE